MIQDTIIEIQINNVEESLNSIGIILNNSIIMFAIGGAFGSALTYLIIKFFLQKKDVLKVNLQKKTEDDFNGLFQNLSKSNECKELYKELLIKAHPDNFSGSSKEQKALDISKELGKQKHNYLELKKLDKLIDIELK